MEMDWFTDLTAFYLSPVAAAKPNAMARGRIVRPAPRGMPAASGLLQIHSTTRRQMLLSPLAQQLQRQSP